MIRCQILRVFHIEAIENGQAKPWVSKHLATCDGCRSHVEKSKSLRSILAGEKHLAPALPRPASNQTSNTRSPWLWVSVGAVVAAALFVVSQTWNADELSQIQPASVQMHGTPAAPMTNVPPRALVSAPNPTRNPLAALRDHMSMAVVEAGIAPLQNEVSALQRDVSRGARYLVNSAAKIF